MNKENINCSVCTALFLVIALPKNEYSWMSIIYLFSHSASSLRAESTKAACVCISCTIV